MRNLDNNLCVLFLRPIRSQTVANVAKESNQYLLLLFNYLPYTRCIRFLIVIASLS